MRHIERAIFTRRTPLFLFEDAVEAGDTGKTGLQCDLRDGQSRLGKKLLGYFYASENQVFMISIIGILFEKSRKMVLRKSAV